MSRPNIVLMISDDHRYSALGALGQEPVRTPNLDGLMRGGTMFSHAYIMGSVSDAVCIPTRAMLLTGAGLFEVFDTSPDAQGFTIPENIPLLPQLLSERGYHTFITGKWHNRRAALARSFDDGAKIFLGGMCNHDAVPTHDFDPSGQYPEFRSYTGEKFSTTMFADAAVDFLNGYESDDPFFLYVAFTAPHDPRTPPPDYAYDPDDIPLPPNFMPGHPFDNGALQIRDEMLAAHPRREAEVRQHIADYYGMISHMDAEIGRVIQAVHDTGRADNTIIIYMADHGLSVGQHGLLGKQNLYEHSVRVPLIISGPGIPQGRRIDALCYSHDLFPTLCELTDTPIPPTNDMQSLTALLDDSKTQHRASVFTAYQSGPRGPQPYQRMVRQGKDKLIMYQVRGVRRLQLFDLEADPLELNDLIDAQPARVAEMEDLLRAWQEQVNDPAR